jgi:CRP-like cAMP-binding protein
VSKGSVEIYRRKGPRASDDEILVGTLEEGQYFGEIGLLYGERRTASVKAAVNSELCSLAKHQLDHALELYPDVAREIFETARKRRSTDAESDFVLDFNQALANAPVRRNVKTGQIEIDSVNGTAAKELRVCTVHRALLSSQCAGSSRRPRRVRLLC